MEFRNLTPFDALCYSALDVDDREHRIIAMKVGYRLAPDPSRPDYFKAEVMDSEPLALCTADVHYGEPGASSLQEESDLAPAKPRCDVLVVGHTYAPGGNPARRWECRLRVSTPVDPAEFEVKPPRPLAPGMALTRSQQAQWQRELANAQRRRASAPSTRSLIDKRLCITGPREFRRDVWGLWLGWRLGAPAAAERVPLRWEYAFGGSSQLPALGHSQPSEGEDTPPPLLNEACFSNPLGRGWMDDRHFNLAFRAGAPPPWRVPAPQIEPAERPIRTLHLARSPRRELDAREMASVAAQYPHQPAGLSPVGRAWAPRLALAGTYDTDWLQNRCPLLPKDFDFGYWNGAPRDQQLPSWPEHARVELWNLLSPEAGGREYACVDLPAHRPFVLLRMKDGALHPAQLTTDTVRIDTDALTISLTHRISVPYDLPVRVIEARFEVDPQAPLLRLRGEQRPTIRNGSL